MGISSCLRGKLNRRARMMNNDRIEYNTRATNGGNDKDGGREFEEEVMSCIRKSWRPWFFQLGLTT